MPTDTTIPALLDRLLREDAARPLLTYYDLGTGERVELSVTTTDNWVAKTANLMQDSLGTPPGARVRAQLGVHWQAVVWALATWRAGGLLVTDDARGDRADVAVVRRDDLATGGALTNLAAAEGHGADEVVALALRPMGVPSPDPLPAGVLDYDAEVLGHGDHFSAHQPPGPQTAAVEVAGTQTSHQALLEAVGTQADPPRPRLLVTEAPTGAATLPSWLAAVAAGGSLVLASGADDPDHADTLAELVASEQVTARA